MSLLARLGAPGPSGFGYGSTAEDVTSGLDLTGRTYLVTGSNAGLGFETLRVLGLRGARVVATARTLEKARFALRSAGAQGAAVECDLSEPASIRRCVGMVCDGPPLDGIIANAGVMAPPELRRKHGYELQFFTNHVGHFLLVTGLLDRLGVEGRVVVLSSRAHRRAPPEGIRFDDLSGERAYSPYGAYGQSKLANLLFALELSRRLRQPRQTSNAVHPGVIRTELQRHMGPGFSAMLTLIGPILLKTVPEGAATQCFAASHPYVAGVTGAYLADCNLAEPSDQARDRGLALRLWEETERIATEVHGQE